MDWFVSLSPVLQGLLATLFTYGLKALGAATVLPFSRVDMRVMDVMLGFSAGVMIAASFWSLIEPALELCAELGKNEWLTAATGFALGGGLIVFTDILMAKTSWLSDESERRSVMLALAVTLHNIPEGLAVGVAFGSAAVMGDAPAAAMLLTLGIGIQNFPEGVCVAMPLRREGMRPLKAFMAGQASGLVEPVAGVLGVCFALRVKNILPLALTFSAGAMIAVVCSELIPEAFRDSKTLSAIGVLAGFIVMMVLDVALG